MSPVPPPPRSSDRARTCAPHGRASSRSDPRAPRTPPHRPRAARPPALHHGPGPKDHVTGASPRMTRVTPGRPFRTTLPGVGWVMLFVGLALPVLVGWLVIGKAHADVPLSLIGLTSLPLLVWGSSL